jgi:hypothetical protein
MTSDHFFSPSYAVARARFLTAASDLQLRTEHFTYPGTGPDGELLATDVALLDRPGADRALVLVSGTHGAEGPAGSSCQLQFLADFPSLPGDTAVVLVHALNPYGFAFRRRVDERNVDVNRNWVDHSDPPTNPGYTEIHDALVPDDWGGPDHARRDVQLMELAVRLGHRGLQAAITAGQYLHPDGLFFGGRERSKSVDVLSTIVDQYLRQNRHVAYIDLHTGLGERGAAEPIFRGGRDAHALERARRWYGKGVTVSEEGTSSSTPIGGNSATVVADCLPTSTLLTAITLEFGTLDGLTALRALQADNWLWNRGAGAADPRAAEVRCLIEEAFNPPDPEWQRSVLDGGAQVISRALDGLRSQPR